jgi:hypothetical protein
MKELLKKVHAPTLIVLVFSLCVLVGIWKFFPDNRDAMAIAAIIVAGVMAQFRKLFGASAILLAAFPLAMTSCAHAKPLAKPVLDIACVLAHAELESQEVKTICRVADELMPQMLDLIAAQRRASILRAAASSSVSVQACSGDAGYEDARGDR